MAEKHKRPSRRVSAKPGAWFVPMRGSYLPVSTAGWLTYVPFMAYLIISLVIAIRDLHSPGLATLFVVPNWIAATAIMTWLAAHKS